MAYFKVYAHGKIIIKLGTLKSFLNKYLRVFYHRREDRKTKEELTSGNSGNNVSNKIALLCINNEWRI